MSAMSKVKPTQVLAQQNFLVELLYTLYFPDFVKPYYMISGLFQLAFIGCAIIGAVVLYKVFQGSSVEGAIRETKGTLKGGYKDAKGQVKGTYNEVKRA